MRVRHHFFLSKQGLNTSIGAPLQPFMPQTPRQCLIFANLRVQKSKGIALIHLILLRHGSTS